MKGHLSGAQDSDWSLLGTVRVNAGDNANSPAASAASDSSGAIIVPKKGREGLWYHFVGLLKLEFSEVVKQYNAEFV